MQLKFTAISAMVAAAAAFAIPVYAQTCPTTCGSYTITNYHVNKNTVLADGANGDEFAIGMLETSTMDSNYTYGDGKTGDAANFGFMKNNWYMYRTAVSNFKGQSASQYNNGAIANNNYPNAINFCNQCISHFGWTEFWEVQRGGQGRIGNWNSDTAEYYNAVNWTYQEVNNNNAWHNDTRYWAEVPAI
jgi:hypothetical protein